MAEKRQKGEVMIVSFVDKEKAFYHFFNPYKGANHLDILFPDRVREAIRKIDEVGGFVCGPMTNPPFQPVPNSRFFEVWFFKPKDRLGYLQPVRANVKYTLQGKFNLDCSTYAIDMNMTIKELIDLLFFVRKSIMKKMAQSTIYSGYELVDLE